MKYLAERHQSASLMVVVAQGCHSLKKSPINYTGQLDGSYIKQSPIL